MGKSLVKVSLHIISSLVQPLTGFNSDFKLYFDQDGARGRETRQLGKPEERA